jgi:hypothetical protein
MRRCLATALAAALIAVLTACAPAGGSGSQPEATESASGAPLGAPSTAPASAPSSNASPSFTTGPTGTPIGDWSLTLTGGPSAGTYSGRDEIVCVSGSGLPTSVASNPVGSPPIGHFDMVTGGGLDAGILVSAGGIEAGGNYQTTSGSAEVIEGPTVTNGVLHLKMSGTDPFPGDPRTLLLEVTCPLFPAETDG